MFTTALGAKHSLGSGCSLSPLVNQYNPTDFPTANSSLTHLGNVNRKQQVPLLSCLISGETGRKKKCTFQDWNTMS